MCLAVTVSGHLCRAALLNAVFMCCCGNNHTVMDFLFTRIVNIQAFTVLSVYEINKRHWPLQILALNEMLCSVQFAYPEDRRCLSALVVGGEKGEGYSRTDVLGWPWLTPGAHQAPLSLPCSAASDVQPLPRKQGSACRAGAPGANSWHQCQALPAAGKLLGSSLRRLHWGGCFSSLGTAATVGSAVPSQSCLWGWGSVLPSFPLGAGHTS